MKSLSSGISVLFVASVVMLATTVPSHSLTPWDSLRVGVDVNYFDYEEPGIIQESGLLSGIYGSYRFDYMYPITFNWDSSIVFGNLDYDGAVVYEDGRPSDNVHLSTPSMIFNIRGTSGVKLRAETHVWTPYIGIGYRYLEDDLPTVYGYIREQEYVYIPLGVKLMFATKYGWSFEGTVEYDMFIDGRNRSHSGAIGRGMVMNQSSGDGARASFNFFVPMDLYPDYSVKFSVEPFVEYWSIGDSDVVGGYYEPKNESTMYGLRFGIEF